MISKLSTSTGWAWLCRFLSLFSDFWLLRFLDCSSKWFWTPSALSVLTCLTYFLRLSFIKVFYHTFAVLKWMWWRELISNTTSSAFFNLFKHDSCNVIATSKTFLCKTLICFMWLNLWFSWKLKAVLKLLFNHYRMHYPIFDRNWGIRIFHIVLLHKWKYLVLQYRQHQILYHSDYHPKRLDSGRFFLISHHI